MDDMDLGSASSSDNQEVSDDEVAMVHTVSFGTSLPDLAWF